MGKYSVYKERPAMTKPQRSIHPIWRGIGCILMVLIPLLSYAGSIVLIDMNQEKEWFRIPAVLEQTVTLPFIGAVENLYIILIVTTILMIIGFGIFTFIYGFFYSLIAPPKYGPTDSPPIR